MNKNETKKEYAIVNKLGYFLASTHLECNRPYISLLTKEEAQRELKMCCQGYAIKKLKIKW